MTIDSSNSLNSLNYINKFKQKQQDAIMQIAAAQSVNSTDGASQQIFDSLNSQVNDYTQGIKNANDATGYLQIADGASQSLTDGADKLNQLSAQLNNGALSQENKESIMSEASKIKESMQQSVNGASFNGKNVFSGAASFYTGGGSQSFAISAPNIKSLDITNQDSIQTFQKDLASIKSTIGSSMNAIQSSINSNMAAITSYSAAKSQIGDTDYATAVNNLSASGTQLNFATMSLAHNNSFLASKVEGLLR